MIAIVAVGYNRPDSMQALLNSLAKADYAGDRVDLVISIDKGPRQAEVAKVAEDCVWEYGEKRLRVFPEKQGLRSHILQCGDLTEEYDAVVVLEDDLIVSKAFYKYVKNTVEFYADDEMIAGISLYSYRANEFCNVPFTPAYNGFDTYLMQVAQSWGQCWTKKMWQGFRAWHGCNLEKLPKGNKMPENIYRWGASSWKKNYMAYLVENNKFFVYPYQSFSTNRSEVGTHRNIITADYQVPLAENITNLNFADFKSSIKYDIFFERLDYEEQIPFAEGKKVCMDLYGLKSDYEGADILVSKNVLPYKIIRQIGLSYRPQEVNVSRMTEGKGFYVYDLHTPQVNKEEKNREFLFYDYNVINAEWKFALRYGFYGLKQAIMRRIKRGN